MKKKINILCIGEPLIESVGTIYEIGGVIYNETSTGYAGDIAPNMAAYIKMVAKNFKLDCKVSVLTALGGPSDEDTLLHSQ